MSGQATKKTLIQKETNSKIGFYALSKSNKMIFPILITHGKLSIPDSSCSLLLDQEKQEHTELIGSGESCKTCGIALVDAVE